jgi:hypothetical protein
MPARLHLCSIFVALTIAAAGCGNEIGDSCLLPRDCGPTGERTCLEPQQYGGYCTIIGCDHDTCPEEAVCVRFFVGGYSDRVCDPATEDLSTDICTLDELCTIGGKCVARSAEARYCMRRCSDNGDCRDGYECRDRDLMIDHGGEPVLPPGERPSSGVQPFCAAAPR